MGLKTMVEAGKATIEVEGKLTVQSVPELEAAIAGIDPSIADIDIELSEVSYISSAGLRVLVRAQKLARSRSGKLRLLHPQQDVDDVFEMTGLTLVLEIVH